MAQKKSDNTSYDAFRSSLENGSPASLYFFYGEEHYLMNAALSKLRSLLVSEGFSDFNFRRFEGKNLSVRNLSDAVDALPVFADRTLIEVHDFEMFKCSEEIRRDLIKLFSELPEYVCLVFVYDTLEYAPDKRLKDTKELLKYAVPVEFCIQDQSRLVKWIKAHFASEGKRIDSQTAEYLSFVTGGLMSSLSNEILKISSFSAGDSITRDDVDAVVTPVIDAAAFRLSNAVADSRYDEAARILDDLIRMREPAHKILFYVSMTMRQLLAARLCIENGKSSSDLITMCGIRHEFQARNLMSSARRLDTAQCRDAVLLCAESAAAMNSGGDPEQILTELLAQLAFRKKADFQL